MGNQFSSFVSDITEGIEKLFSGAISNIESIVKYINPFSDSFILKSVINFLGDLVNYINPFSENFILKKVIEFLEILVSYINPFSDNFLGKKIIDLLNNLFTTLFIPSENKFEILGNKIKKKFEFVFQVQELLEGFFSSANAINEENKTYPSWNITYYGTTFSIIDFEVFDQYRGILHALIIAVCYISFLLKLHRKLPGIIGAYSDI